MGKHIEQRLSELHLQSARTRAMRIFAFTSAVFPGEWAHAYTEDVVTDLLEFAFHARRVNQLCGLDKQVFPSIKRLLVALSEGDPGDWEERYQDALNRLVHVKTFVFGNCHADHRVVFAAAESNLMPLYVRVETDIRQMATISLYGLIDCFLNSVIPEIRKRFPDWKF